MKAVLVAVLVLSTATATAQEYSCPKIYPGNDAPQAPLTGGFMDVGALHGPGQIAAPRDEAAEEGFDLFYGFGKDEQAWLICSYGANKRLKGRFHDGHEWNQRMVGGIAQWWMKLPRNVGACIVQVREIKPPGTGRGNWKVTAVCEPPSTR